MTGFPKSGQNLRSHAMHEKPTTRITPGDLEDPRVVDLLHTHVTTAREARRRGAGSSMLRHIIASARELGMSRLSLETGSRDYFQPARALYRGHGFTECPAFADYAPDPNSVFMTLDLRAGLLPPDRKRA